MPLEAGVDLSQDDRADAACILGHFSTVTHFDVHSPYIVTSDRDARVRISQWPQAFVIRAFCLGHSDVVTVVKVLPTNNGVISAAADGTIRLWSLDGRLYNSLSVDIALLSSLGLWNEQSNCLSKYPAIVGLVFHPTNADAVLFVVHGLNAVLQVTGLSNMTLDNVKNFLSCDSSVTGIASDVSKNTIWISHTGSCTLNYVSLEIDEVHSTENLKTSVQLNSADIQTDNDDTSRHVGRFQWLLNQRKKEMVSDWKGKKRRYADFCSSSQ